MVTDPIADMFMRLRNGGAAGKASVLVPHSDIKLRIANVLLSEGMVAFVNKKTKKGKSDMRVLEIGIAYDESKNPRIAGIERVSRPSRRVYFGVEDIHPVRQGFGVMILSTPKGIMTDKAARKEHVGGEVIGKAW